MTVNQIHRIAYPASPDTKKLRGTLLDTATIDDATFRGQDGIGLFESYSTMTFGEVPANCGPSTKTFDNGPLWVDGVKFGAYGGVICKHTDESELAAQDDKALAAFIKGESTAVERGLMALRFPENEDETVDPGGMPGTWAGPADIADLADVTAPVGAEVGVALAEEWIASAYNGAGTLHMPRSVASLLAGAKKIEFDGDVLYTPLGTKVAAGAGYAYPNLDPDGTPVVAGSRWIYVTGEVVLLRSEVINKSAHRQDTNEYVTLVERGYVASIDGNVVGAIRVDIEG